MKFSMSMSGKQAACVYGTGISMLFGIVILIVTCSCSLHSDQDNYDRFVKENLSGEYQLHRISSSSKAFNTGSGFFVFGTGGYSSGGEISTVVRFAWEFKKNRYMVTTVPIDYVQVKLVGDQKTPAITFHTRSWSNCPILGPFYYPTDLTSRLVEGAVDGVTVICRPDQWPLDLSGLKKLE